MGPDEVGGTDLSSVAARPPTFQGRLARGRAGEVEDAAIERLEGRWYATSRYRRRARVTAVTPVTTTGTVRLAFEVIDGERFAFDPGQFVGIEREFLGSGFRRSPYCILTPPTAEPVFELLVRVVAEGPLSQHLGSLSVDDVIAFRGPTGRSMIPKDPEAELILLATGVGIAPFYSLARHLLGAGRRGPVRLYWGLRLAEDLCLLEELEELAASHPSFSYAVSLSQPPPGWSGLRGRLTESVPPLLETVGGKRYLMAGNGAMIAELSLALSDVGVGELCFHKEPYFKANHEPEPRVVAAIRARFVAPDVVSQHDRAGASSAEIEEALHGRAADAAPGAASDLFELMPVLLAERAPEDAGGG